MDQTSSSRQMYSFGAAFVAVLLIPIHVLAAPPSPPIVDVNVTNVPLEVTGEVTGTLSGEVEVTNNVDTSITNTVGVDVLSLPDSFMLLDDFGSISTLARRDDTLSGPGTSSSGGSAFTGNRLLYGLHVYLTASPGTSMCNMRSGVLDVYPTYKRTFVQLATFNQTDEAKTVTQYIPVSPPIFIPAGTLFNSEVTIRPGSPATSKCWTNTFYYTRPAPTP